MKEYNLMERNTKVSFKKEGKAISYEYDLGGQLSKVVGEHFHRYDYVRRLGYDKFGQRIYMQYCNGTETFYGYDARNRRMDGFLSGARIKVTTPYLSVIIDMTM